MVVLYCVNQMIGRIMHPHLENASNSLGIELPAIKRAAQLADSDIFRFTSEVHRIIEEANQKEYTDIKNTG